MNSNTYFCFLLLAAFTSISVSCTQSPADVVNTARVPFTINPIDRKITLPILLNDSITANMNWDTGAALGTFELDSTFSAVHPSIIGNMLPDAILPGGSAWTTLRTPKFIYNVNQIVKIGCANIGYNRIMICDRRGYMGNPKTDGLFNIPSNDTAHVWELNFECNYLEIHSNQNFSMPQGCFVVPLVKELNSPYPFYIELPIKIKCKDGDTLTLNRTFLIDTGMSMDVALMHRADELEFFNEQESVVWTIDPAGYYRSYTVDATLFENTKMDSLRIYTFDQANDVLCNYLIGLNFLKRFNVFFDIKNQRIGLQPIKNFQRVVDPLCRRFHMSHPMNSEGKFIVTKIADYKENYVKLAGMREGDEVIAVNGTLCKDITDEKGRFFQQLDTLIYDILREGKPMRIVIPIDKNEVQGD